VSEYLTDEEQAERLKQWWKENGRSILVGIVVGLGLFGGWQGWQTHLETQAVGGSAAFDRYMTLSGQGNLDAMKAAQENLAASYPDSTYADLAALDLAGRLVEEQQLDQAQEKLRTVYEQSSSNEIRHLARLRLIRVLLASETLDEAETLLNEESPESLAGEVAALKGDLARLRGDYQTARAAYEQARTLGGGESGWLELVLQNLPQQQEG
jgi:predicted negative regulator of RcsB-dependent stress response